MIICILFILNLLLFFYHKASSFQNVVDRQISTGNLLNAQTIRKEKFPREFFPEVKMIIKEEYC
jgi:hypothetical protein